MLSRKNKTKNKRVDWFVVDDQGMSKLHEVESKSFIIRELIQNAFDEEITQCNLYLEFTNGIVSITIEDDCVEGFKDLRDAYTLYSHNSKREDAKKRGRFNLGEKQAISQAEFAMIKTTKGTVVFDKVKGRTVTGRRKRKVGSLVNLVLKMKKAEFDQCVDFCNNIYVPEGVSFTFHCYNKSHNIPYVKPFKTFTATLPTVIDDGDGFKPTIRKCSVNVYESNREEKYLYELGLPVCLIDCDFDIDVQQKVPLAADRNSVTPTYLKRLYAEVLNQVSETISSENSSRVWVRQATTSDVIADDVASDIFKKRFGNKVLVANTSDKNSIDKAISAGYNIIYGSEMDRDEWKKFKSLGLSQSTSSKFGSLFVDSEEISVDDLHDNYKKIATFVRKVALKTLEINVVCHFIKSVESTTMADYHCGCIRFNLSKIPKEYWQLDSHGEVHSEMYKLIVHEIAHNKGTHYETAYHNALSDIHTKLSYLRRNSPSWFKI